MNNIEQQFDAFSGGFYVLEMVSLGLLAVIIGETIWDFLVGRRKNPRESAANFIIAFGNSILERTVYGLVFVGGLIVTEIYSSVFWRGNVGNHWWAWCLGLLIADFSYYWMHRFEHQIRILWGYHSVHHSSVEFNLTTGLRLSWVEGLIEWVFFVPMIMIGFSALQVVACISIVVLYQTWIHTEKIGTMGRLDRFLNTPSVHRVHHGSNKLYRDKNYGGILIIWDRLFGTYQEEQERVTYGITTPIESWNPLIVNIHEFREILRDVIKSSSVGEAFGYLFRSPGWKPENRSEEKHIRK